MALVLLWVGIFAAGLAARLAPWPQVFGGDRVQLVVDSDTHYHVLRAERMLRGAPGAPWRDPALAWPDGSEISWPPGFDGLIAGAAGLVVGADPSREEIAAVAAILPVVLGLLGIGAAALAGWLLLGRAGALGGAIGCALLPASVEYSKLGRPDQHVAEQLLWLALVAAMALPLRRSGVRAAAVAVVCVGVVVPLSFLVWQGSAFLLLVAVVFVGAVHVFAPAGDPTAERAIRVWALGSGAGAALLAACVVALGVPGGLARADVRGVGGLQIAIVAGCAAFGLLLFAARRHGTGGALRRCLEVAAALALPACIMLGSAPNLRTAAARGLTALAAGNPWYAAIDEFRPMLASGLVPLDVELSRVLSGFGLALPLAIAGCVVVALRARRTPVERFTVGLALLAFSVPLAIAMVRQRFGIYLVAPSAMLAGEAIRDAGSRLITGAGRKWTRAALALAFGGLMVSPTLPQHFADTVRAADPRHLAALTWLKGESRVPGREGVAGAWTLGHLVQYYAEKPVLLSPLVEAGDVAMPEYARSFLFATSESEAEALLARRRIGWLTVLNPLDDALRLSGYMPERIPAVTALPSLLRGGLMEIDDAFFDLVPSRLYFDDGAARAPDVEGVGGFRLLYETPETSPGDPLGESRLKIFGVVPGARIELQGGGSAGRASAEVRIRTNVGRDILWRTSAALRPDGTASLRVPYSTGPNGAGWASPCVLFDGRRRAAIEILEQDVREGRVVGASLVDRR